MCRRKVERVFQWPDYVPKLLPEGEGAGPWQVATGDIVVVGSERPVVGYGVGRPVVPSATVSAGVGCCPALRDDVGSMGLRMPSRTVRDVGRVPRRSGR